MQRQHLCASATCLRDRLPTAFTVALYRMTDTFSFNSRICALISCSQSYISVCFYAFSLSVLTSPISRLAAFTRRTASLTLSPWSGSPSPSRADLSSPPGHRPTPTTTTPRRTPTTRTSPTRRPSSARPRSCSRRTGRGMSRRGHRWRSTRLGSCPERGGGRERERGREGRGCHATIYVD